MTVEIVWIGKENLRLMCAEASDKYPNETGGCFNGYYTGNNKELVLTNIIGPGPNAVHGRYYFKPDDDWQTEEIAKIYGESGRAHIYLGDWHVHTAPNEKLSWKDKKTLRRIAKYAPARIKTPIMGVMCFHQKWELTVWQLKELRSFFFYDNSIYEKLELKLF